MEVEEEKDEGCVPCESAEAMIRSYCEFHGNFSFFLFSPLSFDNPFLLSIPFRGSASVFRAREPLEISRGGDRGGVSFDFRKINARIIEEELFNLRSARDRR